VDFSQFYSLVNYDGVGRSGIARVNTDGTLDTTFTPGTGANAYVQALAIQSDGKIIIGGSFTLYNGVARSRIARINTDGTIDSTFLSVTHTGLDSSINTISLR